MKLFAEKRTSFPDPRAGLHGGLVAMDDDLRVERLLEAYSFGIFPWPQKNLPTLWFCPDDRGVLDFDELHVPRSLMKTARAAGVEYSLDRAFDKVIDICAGIPRAGESGTWITPKLIKAYKEFHKAGYAHSLEVWQDSALIGGLYGVFVGGVFSGESMFFLKPNASKLALLKIIAFLKRNGIEWMDIQMVTPLSESFGGKYISRDQFLKRLDQAKLSAQPISFSL